MWSGRHGLVWASSVNIKLKPFTSKSGSRSGGAGLRSNYRIMRLFLSLTFLTLFANLAIPLPTIWALHSHHPELSSNITCPFTFAESHALQDDTCLSAVIHTQTHTHKHTQTHTNTHKQQLSELRWVMVGYLLTVLLVQAAPDWMSSGRGICNSWRFSFLRTRKSLVERGHTRLEAIASSPARERSKPTWREQSAWLDTLVRLGLGLQLSLLFPLAPVLIVLVDLTCSLTRVRRLLNHYARPVADMGPASRASIEAAIGLDLDLVMEQIVCVLSILSLLLNLFLVLPCNEQATAGGLMHAMTNFECTNDQFSVFLISEPLSSSGRLLVVLIVENATILISFLARIIVDVGTGFVFATLINCEVVLHNLLHTKV